MFKNILQGSNTTVDPKKDEEEENEDHPDDGCSNEEHLTRAFTLRVSEGTRWNSLYYCTIVQSDLILSGFLGFKLNVVLQYSTSQSQSIVGSKIL